MSRVAGLTSSLLLGLGSPPPPQIGVSSPHSPPQIGVSSPPPPPLIGASSPQDGVLLPSRMGVCSSAPSSLPFSPTPPTDVFSLCPHPFPWLLTTDHPYPSRPHPHSMGTLLYETPLYGEVANWAHRHLGISCSKAEALGSTGELLPLSPLRGPPCPLLLQQVV